MPARESEPVYDPRLDPTVSSTELLEFLGDEPSSATAEMAKQPFEHSISPPSKKTSKRQPPVAPAVATPASSPAASSSADSPVSSSPFKNDDEVMMPLLKDGSLAKLETAGAAGAANAIGSFFGKTAPIRYFRLQPDALEYFASVGSIAGRHACLLTIGVVCVCVLVRASLSSPPRTLPVLLARLTCECC